MRRTDTIIIGAGQAGLATSRTLCALGLDHVVLERGRLAERWRSERWSSLRLLTPAWMTRLPGHRDDGPDPDAFLTMGETIALLERYARSFAAPVEEGVEVRCVERVPGGYRVLTASDEWRARQVVIATGHAAEPLVPRAARGLSPRILQLVPSRYRRASELPSGGVLVVGASATGAQLAEEIHASGRPVTLAVGRHTRMPRRYRGADVFRWLDRAGVLDERFDDLPDPHASRRQPSLQLVGRPASDPLDLGVLAARGVRVMGRLLGTDATRAAFAGDLAATTRAADHKLARLLARIDRHVDAGGLDVAPPDPPGPLELDAPATTLDLARHGIQTVVWATGFARRYPWLRVPVLDAAGEIVHAGGVTRAPGLYVIGLHLLRTRRSSFIDGVGADARALALHIAARSGRAATLAA